MSSLNQDNPDTSLGYRRRISKHLSNIRVYRDCAGTRAADDDDYDYHDDEEDDNDDAVIRPTCAVEMLKENFQLYKREMLLGNWLASK